MTPKEKATKIYSDMLQHIEWDFGNDNRHSKGVAKSCAYNAIAEILSSRPSLPIEAFGGAINLGECVNLSFKYWQEVLDELKKI